MFAKKPWKVAGVASIAIGAMTGVALANDGIDLRDRAAAVQLASGTSDKSTDVRAVTNPTNTATAAAAATGAAASTVDPAPTTLAPDEPATLVGDIDPSPESADSPTESPFDSPESPTDSPDDPGYIDPSPESADSPTDSPFDSPETPMSPASAVSPNTPDSAASPASADSPD